MKIPAGCILRALSSEREQLHQNLAERKDQTLAGWIYVRHVE
jgi:hypothetical protein